MSRPPAPVYCYAHIRPACIRQGERLEGEDHGRKKKKGPVPQGIGRNNQNDELESAIANIIYHYIHELHFLFSLLLCI